MLVQISLQKSSTKARQKIWFGFTLATCKLQCPDTEDWSNGQHLILARSLVTNLIFEIKCHIPKIEWTKEYNFCTQILRLIAKQLRRTWILKKQILLHFIAHHLTNITANKHNSLTQSPYLFLNGDIVEQMINYTWLR